MKRIVLLFFILITLVFSASAQEEVAKWDNWLIMGNKLNVDGGTHWRYSNELQWRADNNLKSLERIFYEGTFTYSPNKKWDIVPDIRLSITPDGMEVRPGLGFVYKIFFGKDSVFKRHSIAQQFKYQADITSNEVKHGVRYIVFYNYIVNKKLIIGGLGGGFYRWSKDFNGIQFVRVGASISWVFNEYNTLSFIEAIGFENRGKYWTYANFPILQLIIRIKRKYRYREPLMFSF